MEKPVEEEDSVENSSGREVPALRMIRPSEVPIYLRDSEFYKSLDLEDDEEFVLPAHLMKDNADLRSMEDACALLHTVRFWGLDTAQLPIVMFALTQPFGVLQSELNVFADELPFVGRLLYALNDGRPMDKRLEAAMKLGFMELVRHLDETACTDHYTPRVISTAAGCGHYACLQHTLLRQNNHYQSTNLSVYKEAVANGHIACIELLRLSLPNSFYRHPASNLPSSKRLLSCCYPFIHLAQVAAAHGQLECLKYLDENKCCMNGCAAAAAGSGSLPCLQYILRSRYDYDSNHGLHVCAAAVKRGHFHILQYLHEQKFPLSNQLCVTAASIDNVACLSYLHHHGCTMAIGVGVAAAVVGSLSCLNYFYENGGMWDYFVCHAAALKGHLSCLQYAHTHGCSLLPDTQGPTANRAYKKRFRVSEGPFHLVELVAQRKHWSCVLYLILQNYPLTRGLTAQLVRKHKDSLLKLTVERGCVVVTEVGVRYAKAGNLDGLTYELQHGCDPSGQILCAAARRGRLDCLIYAHEQGCPWSEEVCVAAARGGHLECLQYAREHGCPWDERVRGVASWMCHENIMTYAEENKCPEEEEQE